MEFWEKPHMNNIDHQCYKIKSDTCMTVHYQLIHYIPSAGESLEIMAQPKWQLKVKMLTGLLPQHVEVNDPGVSSIVCDKLKCIIFIV